jgi:hypothetical protein
VILVIYNQFCSIIYNDNHTTNDHDDQFGIIMINDDVLD